MLGSEMRTPLLLHTPPLFAVLPLTREQSKHYFPLNNTLIKLQTLM